MQTCNIVKSHTPRWVTHKLENNYIAEVLPKEWAPWPEGPALGRWALRTSGFEGKWWLLLGVGVPKGCRKEISFLKGTHKISILGLGTEAVIWEEPRPDPLPELKSLLVRQVEAAAHPGCTDPGGSHCEELLLPYGPWCWQALLWNPTSSLLAPRPGPTQSLQVPVLGHLRPSNWAGTQPHPSTDRLP